MVSFRKLLENMSLEKTEGSDSKALEAIRTGNSVRDNFWEDFLLVINNSEAISDLLDIPISKISGWHQKIKEALEQVKASDDHSDNKELNKNKKVLPTGSDAMDSTAVADDL